MTSISIHQLPFFSSLVKDYLIENKNVKHLYRYSPSIQGLKNALDSKEKNYSKRSTLGEILEKNYPDRTILSSEEIENISLLTSNGFAITTAHQPCLFGGPLYTVSKAISAISLSKKLNEELGEKKIVPIYVIGSEDHDKEELLHTYLFNKKFEWNTAQVGAVGAMKINDDFSSLLDEWLNAFSNLPYTEELKIVFSEAYSKGNTITQATKVILRKLFSHHGLIVLDLNLREVKKEMVEIFEKELSEQFSINNLKSNLEFLSINYNIQAPPRQINLFEYRDGHRTRIDASDEMMIERLKLSPENFSPNVILRPLMQQMVLPSICNIGGGAEVAYWLQLKSIFDISNIDFPVILLRDIFSPLDAKSWDKWRANGLNETHFFLTDDELKKKIIWSESTIINDYHQGKNEVLAAFETLSQYVSEIDKSLLGTHRSEAIKLQNSLEMILAKMMKAEKKKSEDVLNSLVNIKNKIIENNYLIERKENFSTYYLRYGISWIEEMIQSSNPLNTSWKMIVK